MSVRGFCKHTCMIAPLASPSADSMGADLGGWAAELGPFPCSLRLLRFSERVMADQAAVEVSHRLILPDGADVPVVTPGARLSSNGHAFTVVYSYRARAGNYQILELKEHAPDRGA